MGDEADRLLEQILCYDEYDEEEYEDDDKCPRCRKKMAIREGPYGEFYGCVDFPICKGKRPIKR